MQKTRVDKWLWCVRLFKSRSLSTDQCKKGRVKIDGASVKPSHQITPGQQLEVHKNGFNLVIEVVKLLPNRVSAALAQECYNDLTPEEEKNKFNEWYIGKGRAEIREKGAGRPTKRERRTLEDFKKSYYEDWLADEG
jgi:ribosome-associated heat shock protein Hsp15